MPHPLSIAVDLSPHSWQDYGFIEVFAGKAWCSTFMRVNRIPTASFDISYQPEPPDGKQNNMDIRSSAGFGLLSVGRTSRLFYSRFYGRVRGFDKLDRCHSMPCDKQDSGNCV